jgi:hypothetical protein
MKGGRIRGAGLLVRLSCRLSPALSPSNSRKTVGKFRGHLSESIGFTLVLYPSQGERNELLHCFTVLSGETATLARVLRATDAYSIAWGKFYSHGFFASTTTSRSHSHRLKAAEANLSVLSEMRKGSGVSGGIDGWIRGILAQVSAKSGANKSAKMLEKNERNRKTFSDTRIDSLEPNSAVAEQRRDVYSLRQHVSGTTSLGGRTVDRRV